MVINKRVSKIYKFLVLLVMFTSLKFSGTVFVTSIVSSHIIAESSIILAKYLPFPQVHGAGFQI